MGNSTCNSNTALLMSGLSRTADPHSCLLRRRTVGSPAPGEEKRMLKKFRGSLRDQRNRFASRVRALEKSREVLMKTLKTYISD